MSFFGRLHTRFIHTCVFFFLWMPSVSAVLAAIKAETQPDLTDGSMRFSDLPLPLLAPQQVALLTGRPTASLKDPALAYNDNRFFLFVSF